MYITRIGSSTVKFSLAVMMLFFVTGLRLEAQKVLPLYPDGKIPNSKPADIREKSEIIKNGVLVISNVTIPSLTWYPAAVSNIASAAVIIFPGGGYSVLAAGHEGSDVAVAFNKIGITAFVLKYRLPDQNIMDIPETGPLQDGQRAVQLVREHAKEWGIDPNKIGIIGFSAGGHLASQVGTKSQRAYIDNPSHISLRPDFMALIYPVISSDTLIAHSGSFDKLLGKKASPEKRKEFSSEANVSEQTPPTFLVHASNDAGVSPKNSIVFYEALLQHHVPAELHLYQAGGHGYGLNNPTTSDQWFDRLANWLKMNNF